MKKLAPMNDTNRGFTLIELLVVIAIIGILSAVVLASLGTARQKGQDASAKSDLTSMREQAELFYYANGNSYLNVCTATPVNGTKSISSQVAGAASAESVISQHNAIGNSTHETCNDLATGWASEVPLLTGGFFCIDYTGLSTTTTGSTLTSASDINCG